jgi:hypothetical protein
MHSCENFFEVHCTSVGLDLAALTQSCLAIFLCADDADA